MERDEILKQLRTLEKRLYEDQWVGAIKQLETAQKEQWVADRNRFTDLIDRLRNAELETIHARLETHAAELNQGTTELKKALDKISRAAEAVKALAIIVNVLNQIVVLSS